MNLIEVTPIIDLMNILSLNLEISQNMSKSEEFLKILMGKMTGLLFLLDSGAGNSERTLRVPLTSFFFEGKEIECTEDKLKKIALDTILFPIESHENEGEIFLQKKGSESQEKNLSKVIENDSRIFPYNLEKDLLFISPSESDPEKESPEEILSLGLENGNMKEEEKISGIYRFYKESETESTVFEENQPAIVTSIPYLGEKSMDLKEKTYISPSESDPEKESPEEIPPFDSWNVKMKESIDLKEKRYSKLEINEKDGNQRLTLGQTLNFPEYENKIISKFSNMPNNFNLSRSEENREKGFEVDEIGQPMDEGKRIRGDVDNSENLFSKVEELKISEEKIENSNVFKRNRNERLAFYSISEKMYEEIEDSLDSKNRVVEKESSLFLKRMEYLTEKLQSLERKYNLSLRVITEEGTSLFVGLKEQGERILINLRTKNNDILSVLNLEKENIVRDLDRKGIPASLFIEDNERVTETRRERKGKGERKIRKGGVKIWP